MSDRLGTGRWSSEFGGPRMFLFLSSAVSISDVSVIRFLCAKLPAMALSFIVTLVSVNWRMYM